MGSFSWVKVDELTKVANVVYGKPFKFLIPEEFGGGFIKECYQDYGRVGVKPDGTPKYDVYELLAFWNRDMLPKGAELAYDGEFNPMKEIDQHTGENRSIGIRMGCYEIDMEQLRFPVKFASASFKGTYEDVDTFSKNDPNQGFYPLSRTEYNKMKEDWAKREKEKRENLVVKFGEWECKVFATKYADPENLCLQLYDEEGPVATATVNTDEKLPPHQAYIKDYSENEGMLKALKDAGVIVDVLGMKKMGYAVALLCKINLKLVQEVEK